MVLRLWPCIDPFWSRACPITSLPLLRSLCQIHHAAHVIFLDLLPIACSIGQLRRSDEPSNLVPGPAELQGYPGICVTRHLDIPEGASHSLSTVSFKVRQSPSRSVQVKTVSVKVRQSENSFRRSPPKSVNLHQSLSKFYTAAVLLGSRRTPGVLRVCFRSRTCPHPPGAAPA
jgi:hypothetical protein